MKQANGSGSVVKVENPDNPDKPWKAAKNGETIGFFATPEEAMAALEEKDE